LKPSSDGRLAPAPLIERPSAVPLADFIPSGVITRTPTPPVGEGTDPCVVVGCLAHPTSTNARITAGMAMDFVIATRPLICVRAVDRTAAGVTSPVIAVAEGPAGMISRHRCEAVNC